MLIFLILVTAGLAGYNLYVTKDYMHPSSLFCVIFLVCEISCLIAQKAYAITIHLNTALVLLTGCIIFTVIGYLIDKRKEKAESRRRKLKKINIDNRLVIVFIVLYALTNLFFIWYLRKIYIAHGDPAYNGLGGWIHLFDNMTKFWTTHFKEINVSVPMFYRVFNPITNAFGLMLIYVMVNNFIVEKKVNYLHCIVVFFMVTLIFLNGSRSPLLRIATYVFALYYILSYRNGMMKKWDLQFFKKIVIFGVCFMVFMILSLFLMGRSDKIGNLGNYLFIYIGAPIVNLDTYLNSNPIHFFGGQAPFFGAYTFRSFFVYINRFLHLKALDYPSISVFVNSPNGIEIGNVYTTYYKVIYDFGYFGVVPIIGIIAFYYLKTYQRCMDRTNMSFDYELFIFAYLFNDLIMLFFSNRFFETVLDGPFYKLVGFSFIFYLLFFVHKKKVLQIWDQLFSKVKSLKESR